MTPKKRWVGRIYLGLSPEGKPTYRWVGRFVSKRQRDLAVAKARVELATNSHAESLTCDEWAARWLARYAQGRKASTVNGARAALRRFLRDFGRRPLADITRLEASDWAGPRWTLPTVVTFFNAAIDMELLDRNPFRGLTSRSVGRSNENPPTETELAQLAAACAAHGWYGPQLRSLLMFAAYSGLRPGELFGLEWDDIDLDAMRIHVQRRVYEGKLDLPKSNRGRTVALTPIARDALLALPTRAGLVFRSKRGKRMSQATLSGYWAQVKARAGLEFDFYHATRHVCAHHLYVTLRLEPRVVAQQFGWSLGSTLKMLAVYGHGEIGALEEIDRAFAANVVELREAKGGQSA